MVLTWSHTWREFKHDVYGIRQTAKSTSDFLFFSCNLETNHTKMEVSLTIHCQCKCFDSTVQGAEGRRQKFHFCSLPFAVNVMLNLSIVSLVLMLVKLAKANKGLLILRTLRKEQYDQNEIDLLFKTIVLPNSTYGLSVYGAYK